MAYILYALFTLAILTRLISPWQISTLYLLPKKTLGWYHVLHSLSHYLCIFFPLHCFFVFVFLLQFLICKREKMRSYHSLMCSPISLQWVAHYYKGTGTLPSYATLCCAMLCYACSMWWPLWKCSNNGKRISASRGGLYVFKAECTQPILTWDPQIKFKGQIVTQF